MFDTLFHYPGVLARHSEGPLANEREQFLSHCARGGAAHSTLMCTATELLQIARRIHLDDNGSLTLTEVEAAAKDWVEHQQRHHRIKTARFSRERFIQTALAWLRFLGRVEEPQKVPRFR